MKKIILATMLAFALVGCSDPKEASEKNFEVAIQRFLDAGFPVCVIRQNFPTTPDSYNSEAVPIYEEMTKLGLLTKSEQTKPAVNKYTKAIQAVIYDLTTEGKKYYQNAGVNLFGKEMNGICFGRAEVKEIIDFTQPSEMLGVTISSVNFTYSVSDVPDWAKKPAISSLNAQIQKLVEATQTPIKAQADMVLTNKGWKHRYQDALDKERANMKK